MSRKIHIIGSQNITRVSYVTNFVNSTAPCKIKLQMKHGTFTIATDIDIKSREFNDEQIEEVKKAFLMYDKKGNGAIAKKRVLKVMRSLGKNPTEDEFHFLMKHHVISNKNKVINFQEFLELMKDISPSIDGSLKEAFSMFDTNNSGTISPNEFRDVMVKYGAQMTHKEIDEMISHADLNKEGLIDLEEFSNLFSAVL